MRGKISPRDGGHGDHNGGIEHRWEGVDEPAEAAQAGRGGRRPVPRGVRRRRQA